MMMVMIQAKDNGGGRGVAKSLDVRTGEEWRPRMAVQSHTVLLGKDPRLQDPFF